MTKETKPIKREKFLHMIIINTFSGLMSLPFKKGTDCAEKVLVKFIFIGAGQMLPYPKLIHFALWACKMLAQKL